MENDNYKLALVVNEYSSGGSFKESITEELYRQIDKFQQETNRKVSVTFTRSKKHLKKAILKLQENGYNFFITAGGDGTLNDIIQYFKRGTILIPLPIGNANDFASRLNIKNWRDTLQVVKNILNGKANLISMDLGEIVFKDKEGNKISKRFINNCGLGVTAETVRRVDGQIKKKYLSTGFFALMGMKPLNFTFYSSKLKKNIRTRCLGFEILLTPRVGRHAHLAPYKHMNDGTLHFTIFKATSFLDRIKLISLLQFGNILVNTDLVDYYHGRTDISGNIKTNPHNLTINDVKSIWGMFHDKTLLHVDGNLIDEFSEIIQKDCRINLLEKYIRTVAPC